MTHNAANTLQFLIFSILCAALIFARSPWWIVLWLAGWFAGGFLTDLEMAYRNKPIATEPAAKSGIALCAAP